MKNIQLMFSSSTKRQAYIFIFLSLLVIVPTVQIIIGNVSSPFNSDAFAIYVGSIFVLWTIPALVTRFSSPQWGYVMFIIFTTFWVIGESTTNTNKEIQSSIAKSVGEILGACKANMHLQKNYCSDYVFNEEVTNICKTDLSLLAPKDMQIELKKSLSGNATQKMLDDLINQIDNGVSQAKSNNNFSNDALCAQVDKTTHNAYLNAIQNIATQKNK